MFHLTVLRPLLLLCFDGAELLPELRLLAHPVSGLVLLEHIWFWRHKTHSVTLSFMKCIWAEDVGVYYQINEQVFSFGVYSIILMD